MSMERRPYALRVVESVRCCAAGQAHSLESSLPIARSILLLHVVYRNCPHRDAFSRVVGIYAIGFKVIVPQPGCSAPPAEPKRRLPTALYCWFTRDELVRRVGLDRLGCLRARAGNLDPNSQ